MFLERMDHVLFIPSAIDGHLGHFRRLAAVASTTGNLGVQMSHPCFRLSWSTPRSVESHRDLRIPGGQDHPYPIVYCSVIPGRLGSLRGGTRPEPPWLVRHHQILGSSLGCVINNTVVSILAWPCWRVLVTRGLGWGDQQAPPPPTVTPFPGW